LATNLFRTVAFSSLLIRPQNYIGLDIVDLRVTADGLISSPGFANAVVGRWPNFLSPFYCQR
jgi:hypothetical protein